MTGWKQCGCDYTLLLLKNRPFVCCALLSPMKIVYWLSFSSLFSNLNFQGVLLEKIASNFSDLMDSVDRLECDGVFLCQKQCKRNNNSSLSLRKQINTNCNSYKLKHFATPFEPGYEMSFFQNALNV